MALYVVSIMAGTDAIGLWLLFDPKVVYDSYTGAGALADQHRAGAVMFTAGMVPLLARGHRPQVDVTRPDRV